MLPLVETVILKLTKLVVLAGYQNKHLIDLLDDVCSWVVEELIQPYNWYQDERNGMNLLTIERQLCLMLLKSAPYK